RKIGHVLGADQSYGRLLVKNPLLTEHWYVTATDVTYELSELSECVAGVAAPKLHQSPDTEGRNSTLFTALSRWAAQSAHTTSAKPDFNCTFQAAQALNAEFECPLPNSEVKAIARSVS